MKFVWPSECIWLAAYLVLSTLAGALSVLTPWSDPWIILLIGPVFLATVRYRRSIWLAMLGINGLIAIFAAVARARATGIWFPGTLGSIALVILTGGAIAEMLVRILEKKKHTEEHLRNHDDYLAALHETSLGLINHLDLNHVLSDIVTRAASLLGTPHGYLYLAQPDGEYLEVKLGTGMFRAYEGYRLKPGEGLSGQVWQTGLPKKISDYSRWQYQAAAFGGTPFRAIAAVPLKSGKSIVGVIGVGLTERGAVFSDTQMDVLERFADLASIAVENASLHHEVQVDLDERRTLQEALLRQATTDYLTGIANRAHFMERFSAEIQRSARYGRPLSVLVLDIDKFKTVNDTRGHAAGDEALRTLVVAIEHTGLRQSDFAGRLGGDEFAIALPETTENQAFIVAQRIRKSLGRTAVHYRDESFFISVSIGVAQFREDDDQDTLLQRADEAMYIMKQSALPEFRF